MQRQTDSSKLIKMRLLKDVVIMTSFDPWVMKQTAFFAIEKEASRLLKCSQQISFACHGSIYHLPKMR